MVKLCVRNRDNSRLRKERERERENTKICPSHHVVGFFVGASGLVKEISFLLEFQMLRSVCQGIVPVPS